MGVVEQAGHVVDDVLGVEPRLAVEAGVVREQKIKGLPVEGVEQAVDVVAQVDGASFLVMLPIVTRVSHGRLPLQEETFKGPKGVAG